MNACELSIAGELLLLLPQKAIYWPRERTLIVADVHFGKAASFRTLGIPVPRGTTSENLHILDTLITSYDIEHIVFLGDFLHGPNPAVSTMLALSAWRVRHSRLVMTLVRGNHDLRAGDPPADLNFRIVDEPAVMQPFAFCHHPSVTTNAYVLAGHVHPAYRLSGRNESLRLPCFVFGAGRAILPSFGSFTGGYTITRQTDEQIFVVADDAVIAIGNSKTG
ncbi:ligase-associated DNA damage response endonuclease PdeM [Undibacterium terreum]|uniref:DEAD/DEAH box helicase n=1 Tax=Undibacterium terreum TaxID=1224302 RepID=A0A916UHP6_9BURK|nr:ligase-associated DNA damage response endonuclease PdeM [Undibacterium terreum]GGC73388.1 DEAD/DEAH box helicase [Undibacterium terreum]